MAYSYREREKKPFSRNREMVQSAKSLPDTYENLSLDFLLDIKVYYDVDFCPPHALKHTWAHIHTHTQIHTAHTHAYTQVHIHIFSLK